MINTATETKWIDDCIKAEYELIQKIEQRIEVLTQRKAEVMKADITNKLKEFVHGK